MRLTRNLPMQTRRDAWVEIDLGALEHNVRQVRRVLPPDVTLMAIVKADAYGHGAAMTIPTLEAAGVKMVGVAAMDEAIQIRQAGLEIPILVIGPIPDWSLAVAAEYDIQLTVFDPHHLPLLAEATRRLSRPLKVHIKVDTGMHRIGVDWREAAAFVRQCQALAGVSVEGVFSHLACGEEEGFTTVQQQRWEAVLAELGPNAPPWVHLANSAGALHWPQTHYNLVRVGLACLGYAKSPGGLSLRPSMGLKGRIIRLHGIQPGDEVSYSHSFQATTPMVIATIPMGYADGVPRALSNRIHGLLHGVRVPQVGVITMDQMMFDVTAVPDAAMGESITLLGEDHGERITLTDWAALANTIEYELMCGLRVRLPRTYTRTV